MLQQKTSMSITIHANWFSIVALPAAAMSGLLHIKHTDQAHSSTSMSFVKLAGL
jgi:hypothetical protein